MQGFLNELGDDGDIINRTTMMLFLSNESLLSSTRIDWTRQRLVI